MEVTHHYPEPGTRVVFSPSVLVAIVWAGVQALLLVYFRVVLLYPTEPAASLGEFMQQVFSGSSAAGPAFATVLFVVNGLFIGLIWLKFESGHKTMTAMVTCAGMTALLLYLQWKWLELLRSAV